MKFDLIYSAIKKLIYQYNIGARLPSEQRLSVEFNVSRVTIRKALAQLKYEGIIASQQGKGYFLIKLPQADGHDTYNLIETLPKLDEFKLLHFELLTATLNLSQLLKCNSGDRIFWVKKQLNSVGQAKIIIDQYIPFNQQPSLSVQDVNNNAILAINLFQSYNEHIHYQIMFKPINAESTLQKMLGSEPQHIMQQAFITAKKLDNSLLYFTIMHYDPNQIRISFNYQTY